MQKFTYFFLVLILFVLSGCATATVTVNKQVKDKFDPMVDTATYEDVLAEMSKTSFPKPFSFWGNCDLMQVAFGNTKFDGCFFEGERYDFIFGENKILKWYYYKGYGNGYLKESTMGGDMNINSVLFNKPASEHGGCPGYSDTKKKKPVTSKTVTLERRLDDLKGLRDKGILTEDAYEQMREKTMRDYK